MTRACFNGCSFTAGEGFSVETRDTYIYDRLVARHYSFESENIAVGGSSNYKIFMRSCQALLSNEYDIIFTQWSVLNRIWLSPGPDSVFFINDLKHPDFQYRNIYLSKKEKDRLRDVLQLLNHDYQNILDLVDYCHVLENLAKNSKTKIVFINGLVPWANDLIQPIGNNLDKSLSEYTKSILDFDLRDDDEIIRFFTVLQEKMLTLDQKYWVNIFNSFQSNVVDVGPEGHHPGVKSHQQMADQIINYIDTNKIL
jgi:hypothetical protein